MVGLGNTRRPTVEFVWSDELALLLAEEDGNDRLELSHWFSRPIAHRLPDGTSPLTLGRDLLEQERAYDARDRSAS